MNVIFLSKDNIGRSQIAEAWFNYLSLARGKNHRAVSAATEMIGEGQLLKNMGEVTKNIMQAAREDAIDLSEAIRKPLSGSLLKENNIEKIILLSTELFPENVAKDPRLTRWDVRDPKDKSMEEVRIIKDEIRSKVTEFWQQIDEEETRKKETQTQQDIIDK